MLADSVVCSSTLLQRISADKGVPQPYTIEEHFEEVPLDGNPWDKPLVAGYMGTDGLLADQIRAWASTAGWQVQILCRPENGIAGSIEWQEGTWQEYFRNFRVLLAPQRVDHYPAKSPAKVVQGLGNGLPVVASNLPAYVDNVRHGVDGVICQTESEWKKAFSVLADNHTMRYLSENATQSPIRQSHSLDSIARQWLAHFTRLRLSI